MTSVLQQWATGGNPIVNNLTQKTSDFSFPQVSQPLPEGTRGIASLTHGGRTLRFRTNPNEFNWTYSLNKKVEQTYGGRVIQLLSTKIDDFTIKVDCGGGRWPYANQVARFLRDVMIDQRKGVPATFEYTTRGWRLNVYVVSIPYADAVEEVVREIDIGFKVQEDVSGVMSRNSLSAELSRLKDGIGFRRDKYNDPRANPDDGNQEQGPFALANTLIGMGAQIASQIQGYVQNPFATWLGDGGKGPVQTTTAGGVYMGGIG